jgi:hypothetical protein
MRCLQIWQYSGAQAEQTLDAAIDTCLTYGFDTLLVKALDGTMWMGAVDSGADALRTLDDVALQSQYANARGIRFVCWTNPLQADMMQQADMSAAIANACDGVAFDTEPYAGFLGAYPPVGLCASFMQRVRSQVDQSKIIALQPDPRENALLEVRFWDEWAPNGATHYMPQDYVTDFYFNPTADLMRALLNRTAEVAAQTGLVAMPTLPGNCGDNGLFAADTLQQFAGFVSWRMGTTPPDALSFLGGTTLSQPTEDPCSDAVSRAADLEVFVADIADRVVAQRLGAELQRRTKSGAHAAISRTLVASVIAEAEAERTQILHSPPPSALHAGSDSRPRLHPGLSGNIAEGANQH